MKDVGGGTDEYLATIILDVVRVLVSCVACVLLRRLGRRPLAVCSAACTGLSLLALAASLTTSLLGNITKVVFQRALLRGCRWC